jgi:hypothetical protein
MALSDHSTPFFSRSGDIAGGKGGSSALAQQITSMTDRRGGPQSFA